MKKIDIKQLKQLISTKVLEDIDLNDIDLNDIDFSSCVLNNVLFSKKQSKLKLISNINFDNAKLTNVHFDNAILTNVQFDNSVLLNVDFSNALVENCSFQIDDEVLESIIQKDDKVLKPTISKVTFAKSKIDRCRFRNSIIDWSDFRYAEITNTTFENSRIDFCDFYRTHFHKINIFKKAQISNSSLNYTLFEGTIIRKENIVSGIILQENRKNYEIFLVEWKKNGPGIRKTDANNIWEPKKLEEELNEMHGHAENIYKNLNGNWISNGFFSDANWAYVKAKRKERERLRNNLSEADGLKQKLKIRPKISGNYFCDIAFGYGESISKIIRTYVALIVIFGLIIHFLESNNSIFDSFIKSLLNMVAQTNSTIDYIPFEITLLNIVQSSIGILLTGVFGFIIANRIRHQ